MTIAMNISVVIPLYNKAPYIKRAIDSILNQTVQAAEILVVDDGSTDDGGKFIQQLELHKVRVIRQDNSGECAARNRGTSEASHQYVAFLDGDDEWKPDFLRQIQMLIQNYPDCGAYATSAQIVRPDGSISYSNLNGVPAEPWIGVIPNFFKLFQAGYAFNASSVVIPKKILEQVGGFPLGVTISGDVDCWVKIAIQYPIAFSPTRSVIYHQDADNRVGNIYKLLAEMPYIQTINKAIEQGIMPLELKPEAEEFMAQKQIVVAIENIMTGNPGSARILLASCRQTKKYRRDWLWWRMWASLPAGWPLRIMKVKQALQIRIT